MAKAAAKPAAPAVKKSSARKVMITCAVTGAIHTPSMSPHLPVTPEEIAEASVGAHEAGAALVHVHARDPKTGASPINRPKRSRRSCRSSSSAATPSSTSPPAARRR